MQSADENKYKRISIDLPERLIRKVDRLRKEWGFKSRGSVIQKLLDEALLDEKNFEKNIQPSFEFTYLEDKDNDINFNVNSSLVLIDSRKENDANKFQKIEPKLISKKQNKSPKAKIDLPSFLSNKEKDLKKGLKSKTVRNKINIIECNSIKESDLLRSRIEILKHWDSLYGTPPNKYILDVSMKWLANDIWRNFEGTENLAFSWPAANLIMSELCPFWISKEPSLDQVILIAGVLEDPYGTAELVKRIPTIIRRFTSCFKKSTHGNSFETLASTMTVVGALKLLDLPTSAGSSHTLNKIREAYRQKALETHPDSGGSSEQMRKVNEAYQLLKNLYRNKST